jgi:hypothetical protein
VKAPGSIRLRLLLGAALVLLAFLAAAGWAVRQAYADSLLAQRYSRLQTTVYLLMAGAELDAQGALQMPTTLAEPRLALPDSGLVASISTLDERIGLAIGVGYWGIHCHQSGATALVTGSSRARHWPTALTFECTLWRQMVSQ